MRGDYIFQSAQHEWENPPEFDEPEATLPELGTCPYCRKDLAWDGLDDTKAWCATKGCRYDNGISEAENRRLWEGAQS